MKYLGRKARIECGVAGDVEKKLMIDLIHWNCSEHQPQEEDGNTPVYAKMCISCGIADLIHGVKALGRQIPGSCQQIINFAAENQSQKFVPRAAFSGRGSSLWQLWVRQFLCDEF